MISLLPFTACLVIAIPAGVIALLQSRVSCKAFSSIVRQPMVGNDIKTMMLVVFAFMETLAIYSLLISLMIVNKF